MRSVRTLVFASMTATILVGGCGSLQEIADCNDVCKWADSCIDRDVSVDDCTERCVDAADKSKALREDAEACVECIEEVACKDAISDCADSCQPVVERAEPKLDYPSE